MTDQAIAEGKVQDFLVYLREISHYFNAEFYNDNQYLDSVALTQELYYLETGKKFEIARYISETETEYYDFMWLDTSSITLLDFGQTFITYAVDYSKKRNIIGD